MPTINGMSTNRSPVHQDHKHCTKTIKLKYELIRRQISPPISGTKMLALLLLAFLVSANEWEMQELQGQFQFQASVDDMASWKARIKALKYEDVVYPQGKWTGQGIVMSAGRRMYFTSAYVTIRILRDHLKCTLPIEVFYAGSDELPDSAIEHMEMQYDVRFVDLTKIDALRGVNVKGYQIKAFSVYFSSFEEVLWLDSDNIPLENPAALFQSAAYQSNSAIFWPDYCNMISVRRETFDMFGKKVPARQPQPRDGKATIWPEACFDGVAAEIETGQLLINKAKSFPALRVLLFLNINHHFFLKRLFHGDKMTFHYAFLTVNLKYFLTPYSPLSFGLAGSVGSNPNFFCGNTMGQRHPDNGRVIFLHRTSTKFKDVSSYFAEGSPPRAWTHYAQQPARSSWNLVFRGEIPKTHFVSNDPNVHNECVHPADPAVVVKPVKPVVKETEDMCLKYLRDLRELPFYPGYQQCNEHSMFFCSHA